MLTEASILRITSSLIAFLLLSPLRSHILSLRYHLSFPVNDYLLVSFLVIRGSHISAPHSLTDHPYLYPTIPSISTFMLPY